MSLRRDWIASPNYSSRYGGAVRLLIVHTAEGALTYQSLGSFFANPSAEVSSHVGIDDTPGVIGEFVTPEWCAWTAGDVNGYSDQVELCAFAAWTRAEWLAHPVMLANLQQWLAEEAARFGIPLVKSNTHGVCGHVDVSGPGGHWDPGSEFPWDVVLAGEPVDGGVPAPVAPPVPDGGAGAPPWPGRYLAYPPIMQGTDVSTWQTQMAARGWPLDVDGQYGPQSEDVCRSFQLEKGLTRDGIVGPETWAAAWSAPVT